MRLDLLEAEPGIAHVARVECRVESYDWLFPRDEAARVDVHWAAQCRAKPALFNGRVLLAHSVRIEEDCLRVQFFETEFKDFLSWRDFGWPGATIANCFAMAALLSADGRYMLGEMGAATSNSGLLYFPAGTPEPRDADALGQVDLASNALRELEEETGFAGNDVHADQDWTIVFDGPRVACMKVVRTTATAAELEAGLHAHNQASGEAELARLVPIASRGDYVVDRMPGFMIRYLDHKLGLG